MIGSKGHFISPREYGLWPMTICMADEEPIFMIPTYHDIGSVLQSNCDTRINAQGYIPLQKGETDMNVESRRKFSDTTQ